jgi:prepilin peptidase CpaA
MRELFYDVKMIMSFSTVMTVIILLIAVVWDIQSRRIPNWLTLPTLVLGVGYNAITGGLSGFVFSLFGMVAGFALFFLFYLAGGMGAGDVKLMAAIGSLLGPKDVLYAAAYTAIVGGVYAVILLIAIKENRKAFARYGLMGKTLVMTGHFAPIPRDEGMKTTPLCYGVAIAIGTLIVLAQRIL